MQWLVLLSDREKALGSNFLVQFQDIHVRLIGESNLAAGCRFERVCLSVLVLPCTLSHRLAPLEP